jgi:hypothetical protein
VRHDIVRIAAVVSGLICAAGGLALGGATWSGQPYTLAVPDHITGAGQARSGSLVMTLDHDTPCTITVSVAKAGDEVLASAGDTLATSYKLTGAALQNGDAEWVDSSTFLTRNYSVPETGPSDGITLWVRAAAGSGRANDAGTYSASVILTASW